jgi:hypothetical protein
VSHDFIHAGICFILSAISVGLYFLMRMMHKIDIDVREIKRKMRGES